MSNKDITIIGAGVIGCTLSYFLSKENYNITLIERNPPVENDPTQNKMAIVMPLISHKNDTIGNFYSQGFLLAIDHIFSLGLNNNGFIKCGAMDINPAHSLKTMQDICLDEDIASKTTYKNFSAFYFKNAGCIELDKLKLAQFNNSLNPINILYNREAIKLDFNIDKQIWSILDNNNQLIHSSSIVIIANSYDAINFSQTKLIPLHAIRGQVTYLPDNLDLKIDHILCNGGYITPSHKGFYHVGATYDRNNLNLELNIESHRQNIRPFKDIFQLDKLTGRVGIRSSTHARRPIIGKVPYNNKDYYPNLYLSIAHGSRALTSGVITSQYLTNLIAQKEIYPLDIKLEKLFNLKKFITF